MAFMSLSFRQSHCYDLLMARQKGFLFLNLAGLLSCTRKGSRNAPSLPIFLNEKRYIYIYIYLIYISHMILKMLYYITIFWKYKQFYIIVCVYRWPLWSICPQSCKMWKLCSMLNSSGESHNSLKSLKHTWSFWAELMCWGTYSNSFYKCLKTL